MLHVADMKEGTNDNDTWTHISLAAARVLERNKISINRPSGSLVGGGGSLRSGETSEMLSAEHGAPRLSVATERDTLKSRGVMPLLGPIGLVLSRGNLPQIDEPVVPAVPIDVINDVPRQSSVDMKPYEGVDLIRRSVHADAKITGTGVSLTNDGASRRAARQTNFPTENACFWLVVEEFSNPIYGEHQSTQLNKQKNENGDHERSSSAEDEKRALDQAEFVKRGLERIRIFEERAAGVDAPVRKRRI